LAVALLERRKAGIGRKIQFGNSRLNVENHWVLISNVRIERRGWIVTERSSDGLREKRDFQWLCPTSCKLHLRAWERRNSQKNCIVDSSRHRGFNGGYFSVTLFSSAVETFTQEDLRESAKSNQKYASFHRQVDLQRVRAISSENRNNV
jgi:hypothetical protein